MGAWSGFGITFWTMFRKTFTQGYPQKGHEKVTAPRYHGRHQLNRWPDGLEKCVGCELCAWACPADAIYVEGADNTDEERYAPASGSTRLSDQLPALHLVWLLHRSLPDACATMTNDFKFSERTREIMICEKHELLAPLLPGMEEPPHPRRLGDDEKDYFLGLPPTGQLDTRTGPGTAGSKTASKEAAK